VYRTIKWLRAPLMGSKPVHPVNTGRYRER